MPDVEPTVTETVTETTTETPAPDVVKRTRRGLDDFKALAGKPMPADLNAVDDYVGELAEAKKIVKHAMDRQAAEFKKYADVLVLLNKQIRLGIAKTSEAETKAEAVANKAKG